MLIIKSECTNGSTNTHDHGDMGVLKNCLFMVQKLDFDTQNWLAKYFGPTHSGSQDIAFLRMYKLQTGNLQTRISNINISRTVYF